MNINSLLRVHSPIWRWVVIVLLPLVMIGLAIAASPTQDQLLIHGHAGYSTNNIFSAQRLPEMRKSTIQNAQKRVPDIAFWGSYEVGNRSAGTLTSPAFSAPPILSVFIAGHPENPGNSIFLERVDTRERLNLQAGHSGSRWLQLYWHLPRSWQGQSVQLIAVDGSSQDAGGGWLGISSPLAVNWFSVLQRQFTTLGLVPYYILHVVLLVVTGLPLTIALLDRYKFPAAFTVMLVISVSCLIGYLAFWAYFLHSVVGYIFSVGILLFSGWQVWRSYRQGKLLPLLRQRDVWLPMVLMVAVGLAYLATLYVVNQGSGSASLAQTRFLPGSMPPDNVIPKLFADKLFANEDPRQLVGDWRSSDRPPLQTGLVLFQRPVMAITGDIGFHYQLLGTVLQCSWVAALWALCRTIQLSSKQQAIVLAFSIFSGFFLFNSIYVWPKLLAAAFTILALAVVLPPIYESRRPTVAETVLAGSLAALGLLSHGGVVFTFPAIALMLVLRPNSLWGMRSLLIGCAVFVLLLLPWTGYQKLYDPPGDRLIKTHFAGVSELQNPPRSPLETILEAYQKLTIPQIVNHKWENVKTLVDNPYSDFGDHPAQRRVEQFFHVIPGLSVLNAGWLVLLISLFQRRPSQVTRRAQGLMAIAAFSIVFWIVIMFGPYTTVIHQGSYATMMLLFTSLAMLLTQLPKWLCYSLLSLHILLFMFDWVVSASIGFGKWVMVLPNGWLAVVMLASYAGIGLLLWWVANDRYLVDSKQASAERAFLPN